MSRLTSKKSRKFFLGASPSMTLNKQKLNQGEEILHFSHPQHPLVSIDLPYLFTCMGCKEYGAGKRYRCQRCELDLHDFCAFAPPTLQHHPFHHKHQLLFITRSGGFLRSRCDVCSKSTKGYAFRCAMCAFEMHPCCATMHGEMNFPTHPHTLRLSPSVTAKDSDSTFVCALCRRKRSGLIFCCIACDYHLHAVCAKNMVNGLYVHGIMPPKKQNRLGTAARLASHAFLGIVGNLIEGIGEGLGEALIDSIGRSRSNHHIRNN